MLKDVGLLATIIFALMFSHIKLGSRNPLRTNDLTGNSFYQDINCLSAYVSISMGTDTISAEVVLKSKSGKSMIDTEARKVTSQNIEQFRPDPKSVEDATHKLQELGFEVPSYSGLTLTILGKPELFEKIFNVNLILNDTEAKGAGVTVQSDRELTVPSFLGGLVEKVIFPPPYDYFP